MRVLLLFIEDVYENADDNDYEEYEEYEMNGSEIEYENPIILMMNFNFFALFNYF